MQEPQVTRSDYGEVVHPLLRVARKRGLSIKDVAKELEISAGYAAQIMERWRAPSRNLISKIAETFDIDVRDLINCPVRPYGSAYTGKTAKKSKT